MNKIIDGYIINLEQDIQRKEHILKEFENSPINLNFFNAIKHNIGWIGCLKSHLELINYAKINNMDMILVIEDDAFIENKEYFNIIFPKILNYLSNNKDKWKIFHGGPNINKHSQITNIQIQEPLLFELSKCVSTTFIIYNSNSYDFFINFYNYPDNKLKSTNKIDMLIYNNFNCITTYPCLIWQIDSFSNVLQTYRVDLQEIKKNRDKNFKRLIKNM